MKLPAVFHMAECQKSIACGLGMQKNPLIREAGLAKNSENQGLGCFNKNN